MFTQYAVFLLIPIECVIALLLQTISDRSGITENGNLIACANNFFYKLNLNVFFFSSISSSNRNAYQTNKLNCN